MTKMHVSRGHKPPVQTRVSLNRRSFMIVAGMSAAMLSSGIRQMAAADMPPLSVAENRDLRRPQFHYTPSGGWMNDPCGMFYHDGLYHLQYQWNPDVRGWGVDWAHAVSKDLIHWERWPVSISQDRLQGDCWSGSAVVDFDNSSRLKTGKDDVLVLMFAMSSQREGQAVGIAYSNDRGRTWTKYPGNPVLRSPDGGKDFRDPRVFWHSPTSRWIVVVSRGYTAPGNMFESSNLRNWKWMGETPNGECPDMFELPVEGRPGESKWVYAAGDYNPTAPNNGVGGKYFIGDFDGQAFRNRSPAFRFGGNFFVGQSFSQIPASDGRRIWIGWKWLPGEKYGALGPWTGGIQTLPVALTLRDVSGNGLRLCQNPVKELQSLRGEHFSFKHQPIAEGNALLSSRNIRGELLEIIGQFQLGAATEFGLRLRKGPQGDCTVGYDAVKQEVFFRSAAASNGIVQTLKPRDRTVRLHILLDRSVVDIFGNDGVTWNCEVFKADRRDVGIELYAKGGTAQLLSLDLWELKGTPLTPE